MEGHKIPDGGPAFPSPEIRGYDGTGMFAAEYGMSLRDWFATHASEADLRPYLPTTVGASAELYRRLGWIGPYTDVLRASSDPAANKRVRSWARYQHADAMIAERERVASPDMSDQKTKERV